MILRRIIIGICVGAFFGGLLALSYGPLLAVILLAFSALCQTEFYALAEGAGYRVYKRIGIFFGTLWLACQYFIISGGAVLIFGEKAPGLQKVLGSCILFGMFFLVLLRTMFDRKGKRPFETSAITLLGIFYIPVLLSYYFRLTTMGAGQIFEMTRAGVFLAFFVTLVVKMSDTGAFAVGVSCAKTIGTHAMFPRISPKKSIEGLVGGILVGGGTGVLLSWMAVRNQWGPEGIFWVREGVARVEIWEAGLMSAGLVMVGVFGDLIESMFKRAASIKDSSTLFQGMGGFLDMADSLIFSPLFFYFFLQVAQWF